MTSMFIGAIKLKVELYLASLLKSDKPTNLPVIFLLILFKIIQSIIFYVEINESPKINSEYRILIPYEYTQTQIELLIVKRAPVKTIIAICKSIIIKRRDSIQHFDWNHEISSSDNGSIVVTDLKTLNLRSPHKNQTETKLFVTSKSIIFQRNKMLEFVE